MLNNIPGESENNSFRKTFTREEGKLLEIIQVILEDIKIYFERFGCLVLPWRAKTAIAVGTLHAN